MKTFLITLLMGIFTLIPGGLIAAPVEVGDVEWGRNYKEALAESKRTGKPVFLLFQEVPGCSGCQMFGKNVLRHPLLVEAIEDEFVPLLIHNNKGGEDGKIRKLYNEPSWNFQVMRFLDADGKDLIPRKDRVWVITDVAQRMIRSLEVHGRLVPRYLRTVADLDDVERHKVAAFAMNCFWVGEFELGKLPGVVRTEAGWYDGREVTRVVYNTRHTNLDRLVTQAAKVDCARKVYLPHGDTLANTRLKVAAFKEKEYRKADISHQKKQIQRWNAIHQIPNLNEMQLARINAWAPISLSKAKAWLSPRQLAELKTIESASR